MQWKLKVLKEKTSPSWNSISSKIYLSKVNKIQSHYETNKNKGISCQQTWPVRNVKRNSSSRKNMIYIGNLDLHKERKKLEEQTNESKIKSFVFLILNWSKNNFVYNIIIVTMYWVIKANRKMKWEMSQRTGEKNWEYSILSNLYVVWSRIVLFDLDQFKIYTLNSRKNY